MKIRTYQVTDTTSGILMGIVCAFCYEHRETGHSFQRKTTPKAVSEFRLDMNRDITNRTRNHFAFEEDSPSERKL